ncbi:MAG: DUF1573 domain-containing protein [Bacteroidota bacterium]
MRYLLFLLLFQGFSSTTIAQARLEPVAPLFKFPKATEGQQLVHYFVFKNTGNAPLAITDYKVGCVCTKVIFPLKPIMPGQTDSIRVNFDTEAKTGYQLRAISIYSNSVPDPVELRFKVFVRKRE